jgi:hypothetical protein
LPAGQGGKAIMSVDTLSQLAMERASTGVDTIDVCTGVHIIHVHIIHRCTCNRCM